MAYTRESGYLQNIVEDGIDFVDSQKDAVEKLRVSNPQSLIDTDFEYSLQASKWEFLTLCNNYPGVYSRSNEPAFTSDQITSILPSGTNNRNVTIIVNALPRIPFKVGDSVVLKETANTTFVDGAYIIVQVPSEFSFVVTTKSPAALVGDQKTPYTAIFTGGFYTNAEIPIVGVSSIPGTSAAVIEFRNPHGLYITTPITVVDPLLSAVPWCGSFVISAVPSDTRVVYQTLTSSNFTTTTRLMPSTGRVYGRSEGVAIHRFFDGGVQINPGTNAPNARIMRQTRKYFKYQSGKSVQFSSGVLFRPVYEVASSKLYVDKYNVSTYPYYDFEIETEQYHGFANPDTYRRGVGITTRGFEISGTASRNPYNGSFIINEVINARTFRVQIPVNTSFNPFPTGDFNPGGIAYVDVQQWKDATVRSGLFDDQNGMFFEYDGVDFSVVKRQSTTPLAGTVRVLSGSPWIVSHDGNSKFLSQLEENDFIVIKGMSYQVQTIRNNLSAIVTPVYRGPNTSDIKVIKTEDLRIKQSEFNIDRLDGTGPSGYVLDLNKMQMIFIDYSWYGAGKIRYGIRTTNGKITYFHEIYNNNVNIKAHIRSGNLPGRFEIQSKSKAGYLVNDLRTNSDSVCVNPEFYDYLPNKGRIIVDNEYIKYTKGNQNVLTLDFRNDGGLTTGALSALSGNGVTSFNQNCSPALSHWGVAALIDGGFNEDKSYLFTASTSTTLTATTAEQAIISLRLAPSVDFGIVGNLGIRNLINHSSLALRNIGILTNNPILVNVRVNCEPTTIFRTLTGWRPTVNGSIAQYWDHTLDGTFNVEGTGGDLIASFYVAPQGMLFNNFNNPIMTNESLNIEIVRNLGNSILGGDYTYPDGPDVLTVGIRTFGSNAAEVGNYRAVTRAKVSWTEDQG